MPSSRTNRAGLGTRPCGSPPTRQSAWLFAVTLLAAGSHPALGLAQSRAEGFAVERLNPAAPGAAWLVMDDLRLQGKLGGAVALFGGYARNPLQIGSADGARRLNVVADQAFVDVGMALLYDRYRVTLNITNPIWVKGNSGRIGGTEFAAPNLDLGKYPDKVVDIRFGLDARLLGDVSGPFRLGLGAQLFVPSGERETYVTDGSYRAMVRVLFAGSPSILRYAGHVGVHLRQRDDPWIPAGPRGSEFLFGFGLGPEVPIRGSFKAFAGPEIYGQTALGSFFDQTTTGLEAMLTGRLERTDESGTVTRFKAGVGEGLHREFGAPDFRCVVGVEVLGRVR
jgi:OmpA-OmpF porin, OOP family